MAEFTETGRPPCLLPERIFAVGEEPAGVEVTLYHKAGAIRVILNALDSEEVEVIRASPFGKLVDIAEKPSFSGRFGRYMISRQLRVAKKHEAWFLFAGKPIRFSIREFAMVTGLNCSRFPKRSKKKSKHFLEEKPYWGELFGSLKEVPVSSVVNMLHKKTVVDREIRLKYAYLSLLSAVILPTTHTPRISEEAAEKIKDLDAFLAYPWGRVSFDMLMTSIKERKEVSLSQNTIALKGFVLALQLVWIECVLALTEVVQEGSSSDSDGETGGDAATIEIDKVATKSISPGHARDTDAAGKAPVESIMLDENGERTVAAEYRWSDDEEDIAVLDMVNLIEQGFGFTNSCFVGGSTKEDVKRMRDDAKAELLNRKAAKTKAGSSSSSHVQDGLDVDVLASIDRDKLKDDLQLLHGNIAIIQDAASGFTETILVNINEVYEMVQDCVAQITSLSQQIRANPTGNASPIQRPAQHPIFVNAGTQTTADPNIIITDAMNLANRSSETAASEGPSDVNPNPHGTGTTDNSVQKHDAAFVQSHSRDLQDENIPPPTSESQPDETLDPALLFDDPTFSLGLTQEARIDTRNNAAGTGENGDGAGDETHMEPTRDEAEQNRRSKRQKVPTKSLMGNYQCDIGFLNRARKAVSDAIYKGVNIDYPAKFRVLQEKMNSPFEITTERGNIQSTELVDVVRRTTQILTTAVGVLMLHTTSLFRSQSPLRLNPPPPPPRLFLWTLNSSLSSPNCTRNSSRLQEKKFTSSTDILLICFASFRHLQMLFVFTSHSTWTRSIGLLFVWIAVVGALLSWIATSL